MAQGKRRRDSIHETPDVSYITNPDVAHEESDVSVRPLLWFVAGLTFFTIVVSLVVLLMFTYFQKREESQELEASPLARQGKERLPPEPRLQLAPGFGVTTDEGQVIDLSNEALGKTNHVPQPQSEYMAVRDEWRKELEDYGWADQQAGTVRVPVSRAMQLYLQKHGGAQQGAAGAQTSSPSAPQNAPGEGTPSPSSSGQQSEQKHQ
jgi:hypothetical protein